MATTLPTRMHIGTQKAGSTYLYNLLETHPSVGLSPHTEVNFFSEHYHRGVEWYADAFPQAGTGVDCSPTYFKYGAVAAQRIAETYRDAVGDLRFVLLLRNPVDYVHSHFTMQRMQGYFAKRPDLYPVPPDSVIVCARLYPQYLRRGRYAALLEEWLRHFSREQFLVVPFEEFVAAEGDVMRRILAFWDLPERVLTAPSVSQNRALRHPALSSLRDAVIRRPGLKRFLKHNFFFQQAFSRVLTVDTKERLSPEARRELSGAFIDDVARLRTLGVDTSFWKDFN